MEERGQRGARERVAGAPEARERDRSRVEGHQAGVSAPVVGLAPTRGAAAEELVAIARDVEIEAGIPFDPRARREGVKIPIYICWSITSNREWGLPFGPGNDFGLYHIDLDSDPNLKRVPTPAVEVYKGIIKQHGGG